jgi:hypothetical protein
MGTLIDLATIKLEQFLPLVNSDFELPAQKVSAKLIEAAALQGTTALKTRSPFRLLFVTAGMPEAQYRQGIMRLDHPQLGTLDLFLVAVGQRESGLLYEAIFN